MLVFLRFNTLKNFVRQWEDNIFIVHHIISFWLDFGCLVSANFWLPSIWLLRNTGKACRTWRQYQGRWCCRYRYYLFHPIIRSDTEYRMIVNLFPRSWGPAAINCLVFPLLPICGIVFTVIFFTIGIYVYNYPYTENLGLCQYVSTWKWTLCFESLKYL